MGFEPMTFKLNSRCLHRSYQGGFKSSNSSIKILARRFCKPRFRIFGLPYLFAHDLKILHMLAIETQLQQQTYNHKKQRFLFDFLIKQWYFEVEHDKTEGHFSRVNLNIRTFLHFQHYIRNPFIIFSEQFPQKILIP